MEISKSKLSNIIWVVFLLGIAAGYVAHDARDAKEISIAANNILADRTNYSTTFLLIPSEIYIEKETINETRTNK